MEKSHNVRFIVPERPLLHFRGMFSGAVIEVSVAPCESDPREPRQATAVAVTEQEEIMRGSFGVKNEIAVSPVPSGLCIMGQC